MLEELAARLRPGSIAGRLAALPRRAGTGWRARLVSARRRAAAGREAGSRTARDVDRGGAACLERVPGELARFSAGEVVSARAAAPYILALPGRRR